MSNLDSPYTAAILQAEAEITRLEREREQIEERIKQLQGFLDFGKMIANNSRAEQPGAELIRKGVRHKKGRILPGSLADDILRMFSALGPGPKKVAEITQALSIEGRKLNAKNPWADIASAMKRHPKIFRRVAPGTYALRSKGAR